MKFFVVLAVCFSLNALAWGPEGHKIVGALAEKYLTDAARGQIDLIGGGQSLEQLSTWADEIRSDPDWSESKPWHFADIPDGETYDSCERNPEGDVVEAIPRFTKDLINTRLPISKRKEALAFIVHFIGDIHQPLHVGRPKDHGGNSIRLYWRGRQTNLHAVWDSALLDDGARGVSDYVMKLDTLNASERAKLAANEIKTWVKENMDARTVVYGLPNTHQSGWENQYETKALTLAKSRLQTAGVRLASWLNKYLK